jgi:hypothetical protein
MRCPKCENGIITRCKRSGWLERQVLWRFGRYPWECSLCKRRMILDLREEPKDKPSPIWTG